MDQSASSSTKVERRILEKNRRNQMKFLYSKLNSLLPNYNPKEMVPVPDQIEQAINYIKSLEAKVKVAQEKKERLAMGRKRSLETKGGISLSSPKMEIREMDSSLEIALITGLDNHFIFYDVIRILHEENIDVVAANFSLAGDLMHHVLHAQIRQSLFEYRATNVCERLKRFVYGSPSDVEIQQELWDFAFVYEPWGF